MKEPIEISNLPEYLQQLGGVVDEGGALVFPKSLGNGYIKIIKPSPHVTLMLQQYEVRRNLILKRKKSTGSRDAVLFSFRNVLEVPGSSQQKSLFNCRPSVQVSSSDVSFDIEVPAHFKTSNIIIRVNLNFLTQLLQKDSHERLAELVTSNEHSYLYEEVFSPKIQSVAAELFQLDARDTLVNFYYKIKAEELIYLFLSSLAQRSELPHYPINQEDIKAIYSLKEELVSDLSLPPHLSSLAAKANMSVSKLGKLFRQIFGDSIYNYYQKIRMQQAAFLLRDEKRSVTEVGYQLGFTNLSHFSRLFEKHTGMKPKKYSSL